MGTAGFYQGCLLTLDGKEYSLLRKLDVNIWQLEEVRTKRIVEYSLSQMQELYTQGLLTFFSKSRPLPQQGGGQAPAAVRLRIPDSEWNVAKVRRAYVLAVLDLPINQELLESVIKEVWLRLQQPPTAPSYASVCRWRKRYLEAGKDIISLVSMHSGRGNRTKRYPSEVIQFVERAIQDVYLTLERGTVQDTVDRAKALVLRENELLPDSLRLPSPTRRLVDRKIQEIPAFDRYAARHGRIAAIKRFRSVQAHRTTNYPLERAEIDHTLLDLMVIDDKSGLPLGRPWITACIDDYTRCILGIFLSFEPPSHYTVGQCLKQVFLPKTSLLKEHPGIKNEWPAHGVMRELVVDNGTEFHSLSLEKACYSLGIEIHYAPRKTPWFKGKIERYFGTFNRDVAHGNPGTTFENILEKDEYDPVKHAVIRFSTIKEVVYTWITDVYHQKKHRALGVSPSVMWNSSITPEEILVPEDPAVLNAILGRSEKRRLTHKGIELYGLLYNSPELADLRRKLGDKLDVDVRVDTSDLGKIYVLSPDGRQHIYHVPALHARYASGLTEWQHRVCKRFAAQRLEQYSSDGWLEAKVQIAMLIEQELLHKKQKNRTRIARYNSNAANTFPKPEGKEPVQIMSSDLGAGLADQVIAAKSLEIPDQNEKDALLGATADIVRRKFKPVYRQRHTQFLEEDQSEVGQDE